MQVFSTFFKIASKRISALSIYFIIYAVVTFMFSITAEDEMNSNFQSTALTVYIMDEDCSAASTAVSRYLSSLHNIADLPAEKEALCDQLYYRTLDYILVIPEGFEKNLTALKKENLFQTTKIPGGARGYFVDQQISQYTSALQIYLAGGDSIDTAIGKTDASFQNLTPVSSVSFHEENSGTNLRVFYLYQYLPYVFIAMFFNGLAPILVIFNKNTIHARMCCSAFPLNKRNLYLSFAGMVYSLICWAFFMVLGLLFYGKDIFSKISLLAMGNSLVFLLVTVAITLLVSLFAPGDNVINMLANIVGLSMSFLCGVFVPQYMLSDGVQAVGKFLPAYWYIKANNMLAGFSSEPFSMNTYFQCLGIELLFATAFFAVTLAVSKMKSKGH